MRKLVLIVTAISLLVLAGSCGEEELIETETTASTTPVVSAHQVPPGVDEAAMQGATEALQVIAGIETDTSELSLALTGDALQEVTETMGQDLAQGRYRKRDYRNIEVRYQDYTDPIVQVAAEFDDFGQYIDVATGAPLSQPTGEHIILALGMVEEEGRWKISIILDPVGDTGTQD